ncbi:enoyl-CoA hydratase [Chromatiales bacterium (ex Bugula neritina AB1)]|nr:enoyl-CoA hydratase [Chromatiales bacterium (ex Bugula neritina AB1)]
MTSIFRQYETLLVERISEQTAVVTLNRPEVRNALNTAMMTDLRDLFQATYVNTEGLRAIVLTGAGDKAFCAGGDLKQRNTMSDAEWQQQHAVLEQAILALMATPLPLIAAVNGDCMGGGLEVALCCDFIYAADAARFALPEGKLGIMPGGAGTQNLPRAVGERRARELIMTGRIFDAQKGYDWRLVNEVVPRNVLLATVLGVCKEVAALGPLSAMQIKKSITASSAMDLASGYGFEIAAYNRLVPTQDRLEGVAAFNEKRRPDFKGN